MSLQVSDAGGKSLFNLFEGQQMERPAALRLKHQLPGAGMYHVYLLVDGAPVGEGRAQGGGR
ncbi:MAG: hypothetical protein IPI07_16420 [Flavobacteriales bacterium]|nr:hypothetical protein [Flavobacteriales bacterium]